MNPEVYLYRMFKNQQTFRFKYIRSEHQAGNLFKPWQIIRRIGKYNVVSCFTDFEVCADINMNNFDIVKSDIGYNFFYPADIFPVLFNQMNTGNSAGRKLIAYTAGACKKIKNKCFFKVSYVFKNVEQTFSCEIGCRSDSETGGQIYSSTPVFASYNSHPVILKRLR